MSKHRTSTKVLNAPTQAAAIHHLYLGPAISTSWLDATQAIVRQRGNRYLLINSIAKLLREYTYTREEQSNLPIRTKITISKDRARRLELAALMIRRGSIKTARKLAMGALTY